MDLDNFPVMSEPTEVVPYLLFRNHNLQRL